MIRQRFTIAAERLGLTGKGSRFHTMDATQFVRPLVVPPLGGRAKALNGGQLDLF